MKIKYKINRRDSKKQIECTIGNMDSEELWNIKKYNIVGYFDNNLYNILLKIVCKFI